MSQNKEGRTHVGSSLLEYPMDMRYWNRRAGDYDEEVLNSIKSDRRGVIARRLAQYGSAGKVATDFGCGVGKYLPALAVRFEKVYAIDFAAKLLDTARDHCRGMGNVRFLQGDLAKRKFPIKKAHFGICQNVLISPRRGKVGAILQNLARHMVKGGHLMVLIPSTESALYCSQQLVEWNRRQGRKGRALTRDVEVPTTTLKLIEGVFDREGVPTKHYLREEATRFLSSEGFETVSVDKVEYDWDSEFAEPPDWLADPYPWDWLLVARKAA